MLAIKHNLIIAYEIMSTSVLDLSTAWFQHIMASVFTLVYAHFKLQSTNEDKVLV